MPANEKYLTTSPWQKAGKISAAILGGYMAMMALHMALAAWLNHVNVIITTTFTGFILWVGLMIVTFLSRSALRVWILYISFTLVLTIIAYLGKWYNPLYLQ